MGKPMERYGTYNVYNVIVMYGPLKAVLKAGGETTNRQRGIQKGERHERRKVR
jgi:hypothetical protein